MKSILLVDDNEPNVTMMLGLLGGEYDIGVALSGKDAIEYLDEELPDLVILDVVMKDTSGIDICSQIKSNKHTSHIPIIVLTATDTVLKESIFKAGADDLLSKPFDVSMLRASIRSKIGV